MELYKFQKLHVYQLALDYIDQIYGLTANLPAAEKYNLSSQLRRSAVSIALNIAEGSTGQSDAEQSRFLGMALRSYLESVSGLDIIETQSLVETDTLEEIRELGHQIFIKVIAFKKSLE